jgi:hypothetical protein
LGSCSGSVSSLGGSANLVSSLLHLVRLVINLSYSYLHGYAYFEYISYLVKVIITFVCGFIEGLAGKFIDWAK